MEETYVYTVVPKRPIRGIVKGKIITKESNLFLTKDEVLVCLKHGPVYRKFYHPDKPERVTPSNLDRLHRAEHITEEEYNALIKEKSTDEEIVDEEESKEPVEVKEVVEESPVEEEVIEEAVDSESEDVDEEVKKVEEEQSSTENEESVEEDVVLPKKSSSSKKKKKKSTRTATSVTAVPETPQEEEQ